MSDLVLDAQEAAPTPPATPKVPQVCRTCKFWQPEAELKGTLAHAVWGHCHAGFDANLTISGRTTTDYTSCSAWDEAKPA
jgi:hypothetical protein